MMQAPETSCPVCHSVVPPQDRFCRRCGAPQWGRVVAAPPPMQPYYASPVHHSRTPAGLFFAALVLLIGVLGAILAAAADHSKPATASASCSYNCGPITGTTVALGPSYTDPTYGYSFGYFSGWSQQSSSGGATFGTSDGSFEVSGQTGSPDLTTQIASTATALGNGTLVQMQPLYNIPGAEIGFVAGSGTVYDAYEQAGDGTAQHVRVAILAATQNNLTVTVTVVSAYTNDPAAGPSGIVEGLAADDVLVSFVWPGTHSS